MMNFAENPFTPDRPVSPDAFVGREKQVTELLQMAESACNGNFRVGYVSGERGIGKSSLALMAMRIAERDLPIAAAHIHLGGVSNMEGFARRSLTVFAENSENKSWMRKAKGLLRQHIEEVGVFSVRVRLRMPAENLRAIAENFTGEMADLLQKTGDENKAMMLVLDDINGLASNPEFVNWLKSAVDGVTTSGRGKPPVCMLFTGLEERRRQMMEINLSVARVFHPTIFVEPWAEQETEEFFRAHFSFDELQSWAEVSSDEWENGIRMCAEFSGGFPMLAQQIGFAVWNLMKNPPSNWRQFENVCFAGIEIAADAVGREYLNPKVIQELRSDKYRAILREITQLEDVFSSASFSRGDLIKHLGESEERVLTNFLNRMQKLGALQRDESGGRGVYRFPTLLHLLYFHAEALRQGGKLRRKK